ncbi:dnaJ homolog subfamily B member 13 [Anastrepha ludens]|uniref:dnaJ homolog subfamily B member 13 n=1 Tax=Anastrepha ludens TaxID=28586 RepID=UPI0023B13756|nr:dnaJ homolog subfamily B member 13 [Anastrepha ludens]XP_053955553.1 dnaJ homolog subfamily B member 13 [Anastrepha ludens]
MNRTELDYYAVLNVPRDAPKEAITLAYRKLAIRLCPHRDPKYERDFVPNLGPTHMQTLSLNRQWEYINMAYDVLGNDLYRAIYDRFGEAGLFQGIYLPNGYFPPYQYHGDHMKVYHDVFGSYSPYANIIDVVTNPPVLYSSLEHGIGVYRKDPPVERIIYLELEEVFTGCTKLMHVWRQEFTDSKETRTEKKKKTLKLKISPGTTAGTRFCFKEEGDRSPTKIPADIIFITADKPHPFFERSQHHNLVYTHDITLKEALVGFTFTITTLGKRALKIVISDVVCPGYTKVLPKEGLPVCKEEPIAPDMKPSGLKEVTFGDLIVKFQVEFPKLMNYKMRNLTKEFFCELQKMQDEAENAPHPLQNLLKNIKRRK